MLSEEITSDTAAAEYLSQKRAWGEDRLGVARLLSLFSPAGHSLVSWAAACGQTEVVEVLMNHGATAELGDETRAVSASVIQVGYFPFLPRLGGRWRIVHSSNHFVCEAFVSHVAPLKGVKG